MRAQPADGTTGQHMTDSTHRLRSHFVNMSWPLAFVLVAVTILVYQPVWHAGFVWDDEVLITGNPLVTRSDGLHRIWLTTEAPDYYPLTSSLWWLEWRLWGGRAARYHTVNIFLHAINAGLVWMILSRLKISGAWLAGLLFATHPVNVATVAWVSEHKNTLSMGFYLLAILTYLEFEKDGGWRWYWFSL